MQLINEIIKFTYFADPRFSSFQFLDYFSHNSAKYAEKEVT